MVETPARFAATSKISKQKPIIWFLSRTISLDLPLSVLLPDWADTCATTNTARQTKTKTSCFDGMSTISKVWLSHQKIGYPGKRIWYGSWSDPIIGMNLPGSCILTYFVMNIELKWEAKDVEWRLLGPLPDIYMSDRIASYPSGKSPIDNDKRGEYSFFQGQPPVFQWNDVIIFPTWACDASSAQLLHRWCHQKVFIYFVISRK